MIKKTLLCAAVSVLASQAAFAGDMGVDVSASADVASAYQLRGLTSDSAAVTGELRADHQSGVYVVGSVVSTSDIYQQNYQVGVAKTVGEYDLDLGYKGYTYKNDMSDLNRESTSRDLMSGNREEVSIDVTRGMVSLSLVNILDTKEDNLYVAGAVNFGNLTGTVGIQTEEDASYSHLQVDYAATENLTFTASKAFSDDGVDENLQLVVGYSIPLM